jgi:hypothetical protein
MIIAYSPIGRRTLRTKNMKTKKIALTLFAGIMAAALFAFINRDNSGWVGTWEYNVSAAPAGYEKGVIKFSEKDGALTGEMITNDETFLMANIKAKNDTVSYDLDVEDTPVNVILVNLKDSISGKVISSDDNYILKGCRKKE